MRVLNSRWTLSWPVFLAVTFAGDAIRDLNDVHEYGSGVTGAWPHQRGGAAHVF